MEVKKDNFIYRAQNLSLSKILNFLKVKGIFILAGVLVILLLLNFLRILPISQLVPFLGFLPQRSVEYSLTASSEISGYTVSVLNEELFIQELETWPLYGRTFESSDNDSTGGVPVSKIDVRLIPENTESNIFTDDEGTYMSSRLDLSWGEITVYVYLAPRILETEGAGDVLLYGAIDRLYKFANNVIQHRELVTAQKEIGDTARTLSPSKVFTIQKTK